jgi:hypothetical protein
MNRQTTLRLGVMFAVGSVTFGTALAAGCGGNTRVATTDGGSSGSSGGSASGGSGGNSGSGGGSDSGSSSAGSGSDSGSSSGSGSGSSSGGSNSGCTSFWDAGSVDASAWGESADGGSWSPICPELAPPAGTKCTPAAVGAYCEYGAAWWSIACNTVMYCETTDGAWINRNPSGTSCFPAPGPNCNTCPENPSGLSGTCSTPGLSCYYGEGTSCTCSEQRAAWECFPPGGCPNARPRVGSPCVPVHEILG